MKNKTLPHSHMSRGMAVATPLADNWFLPLTINHKGLTILAQRTRDSDTPTVSKGDQETLLILNVVEIQFLSSISWKINHVFNMYENTAENKAELRLFLSFPGLWPKAARKGSKQCLITPTPTVQESSKRNLAVLLLQGTPPAPPPRPAKTRQQA